MTTTTSTTLRPTTKAPLSGKDIQRGQDDLQSINNDLALLSSILGRPVSLDDLPELTKSFGIPPPKASSPSSVSALPNISLNEVIKGPLDETTRVKSEIDSGGSKTVNLDGYGQTDDAILATILKQNGIGPANNNIPVQLLLHQVMGAASTPFSRNSDTTPKPQATAGGAARRPRPIVDGLAWLWRTWQETAPRRPRQRVPSTISGPLPPSSDFSAEEYTNDGAPVS